MYALYKCYNDATLRYIEDTLRCFHTSKDVFLLRRAGKKVKTTACALRTDRVKKRMVDKEPNADYWMQSKKRRKMNAWRDVIIHKIDISMELYADFNFPKIHLMSHCAAQIRR